MTEMNGTAANIVGDLDELSELSQRDQQRIATRVHELMPLAADVVAEAIGTRFQGSKGLDVGLLLRGIHTARYERHLHGDAGSVGGLFDRGSAAENDQVGKRNLLAARGRRVERLSPRRLAILPDARSDGDDGGPAALAVLP